MKPRTSSILTVLALFLLATTIPGLAQTTPQPVQLTLKGSWPGFPRGGARGLDVAGNYVYLAAAGLQVIDVSDPTLPKQVADGSVFGPSAVHITGDHAFVWSGVKPGDAEGLSVLDISDPSHPSSIGRLNGSGKVLAVAGDFAYTSGLVLDISDPTQPRVVGTNQLVQNPISVRIVGHYAYTSGDSGFHVLDISDPARPVRVAGFDDVKGAFELMGNFACVAGENFVVLNVSDPLRPTRVGLLAGITTNTSSRITQDVQVRGSISFVGVGGSEYVPNGGYVSVASVYAIDVSNPANPVRVGQFELKLPSTDWDGGMLRVHGRYGYLAEPSLLTSTECVSGWDTKRVPERSVLNLEAKLSEDSGVFRRK